MTYGQFDICAERRIRYIAKAIRYYSCREATYRASESEHIEREAHIENPLWRIDLEAKPKWIDISPRRFDILTFGQFDLCAERRSSPGAFDMFAAQTFAAQTRKYLVAKRRIEREAHIENPLWRIYLEAKPKKPKWIDISPRRFDILTFGQFDLCAERRSSPGAFDMFAAQTFAAQT